MESPLFYSTDKACYHAHLKPYSRIARQNPRPLEYVDCSNRLNYKIKARPKSQQPAQKALGPSCARDTLKGTRKDDSYWILSTAMRLTMLSTRVMGNAGGYSFDSMH